jgi:hypothetical protein
MVYQWRFTPPHPVPELFSLTEIRLRVLETKNGRPETHKILRVFRHGSNMDHRVTEITVISPDSFQSVSVVEIALRFLN